MDAKIFELQGKLPELIPSAKAEIEDKLRFTLFKKMTQGWSIVAAGVKDIWGDYVNNNYQLQNQQQLYNYGFLFFYGLGFGLPALVGNPPLPPIDCGLENYYATVEKYGLSNGPISLASQVVLFILKTSSGNLKAHMTYFTFKTMQKRSSIALNIILPAIYFYFGGTG